VVVRFQLGELTVGWQHYKYAQDTEMANVLELQTNRLFLRPIVEADIPDYEKHFVDYSVIRHLSHTVPWPYPVSGVSDWVKEHVIPLQSENRWFWGIFLLSNRSELIGGIELWRPGTPENRGFWLGRAHWGNGYMTECVERISRFAFDCAGFDELVLSTAVGNQRSSRIKQTAGARLLRTEPFQFVDPIYKEREIWLLTKQDWRQHVDGQGGSG